jgi:L-fuconolactonase
MTSPDFPIVDCHLHLWDPGQLRYPWLLGNQLLNRPYLLEDYRSACNGLNVRQMVFVQCECDPADYRKETEWVTGLSSEDRRIAGIVSWAPLEKGSAAESEIAELAANPLVKGIRRIIQFESDPRFCLRPDFVHGVQLLARYGLSFDLCIKGEKQTSSCIELVRKCPDTRFILDHIGKPFICERRLEPWRTHLREFARIPNVWCKISGLVVEADLHAWTPLDLRPYVDAVLAAFGPKRICFGGDWPVVLAASSLKRWVDTLADALAGLSGDEQRSIFALTGTGFYRLAPQIQS